MSSSILSVFERHPHWPTVVKIIQRLEGSGFKAVLAGGCVRDALLGRSLNDFDVATSATPDEVEKLFPKTLGVGKAFGVMVVIDGPVTIEVATFRSDGEYKDGRHPENVQFSNLEEDAKRRDFTVNALFYRVSHDELIDYVGGSGDLRLKVIRAVGLAHERFEEDKLRVLRAVRFAAQLGFLIENETWAAVVKQAEGLGAVAKERQLEELRKLAASDRPAYGWEMLRKSQMLAQIFPALARAAQEKPEVWQASLLGLSHVQGLADLPSTLAWFALNFEVKNVGEWLKILKASSREVSKAQSLVKDLLELNSESTRLGRRLLLLDQEHGPQLIKFWPLLSGAQVPVINDTVSEFRDQMETTGHLPDALVTGSDLKTLGMKEGPEFGKILERLYLQQLEDGSSREELLAELKRLK